MKTKPIPRLTPDEEERFWSKVDRRGEDECWEWQGATNGKRGYGRVTLQGSSIYAHRLAYALVNSDPGEKEVCHLCDNPLCCNPRHHWLGTQIENCADMVTKGRSAKGERHSQTHLSSADIQAIRESNDYQRVIADRYGVSQSAVSYIRNRIHWKHVA